MTKVARFYNILILSMSIAAFMYAQPGNELYLFSLQQSPDGHYHVFGPKYLSGFNPGGEIKQPSFTSTGDLLVSARTKDGNQNDIWQLSSSLKTIKRLTSTSVSEYFPKIQPGGQYLTVLHEEQGEKTGMHIYKIGLRSGENKRLTIDLNEIENYVWMSPNELGLYSVEGSESRLSYLEVNDNKFKRITTSVGKTILADKNGHLNYVHKFDDQYWYIKRYNPSSSFIDVVAVTLERTEDFALTPDGTYFMSKGHILYSMDPAKETTWSEIADLSIYGITLITGLVVSNDGHQLALLSTKEKR
jgi:hypothetical protein